MTTQQHPLDELIIRMENLLTSKPQIPTIYWLKKQYFYSELQTKINQLQKIKNKSIKE